MNKAYQVVKDFELELSAYTGAPFVVSVSSCTNAILLSCITEKVKKKTEVSIPKITYPGVACSIINAGGRVAFHDENWHSAGWYSLRGTKIIDSAKYMAKGMYQKGTLTCLSFHIAKAIPVGRGGAILLDDLQTYEKLKCLRFDGRHELPLHVDTLDCVGYNCYMTPAQASRGLELMSTLKDEIVLPADPYTDLSKYKFYKGIE